MSYALVGSVALRTIWMEWQRWQIRTNHRREFFTSSKLNQIIIISKSPSSILPSSARFSGQIRLESIRWGIVD